MNNKEIRRKRLPLYVALIILAGTIFEIVGVLHIRDYGLSKKISTEVVQEYSIAFIVAVVLIAFVMLVAIIQLADVMYNRDSLTQVANADRTAVFAERKAFFGHLTNYTGIFVNIKNFKYINNRLGREGADSVLREYATTLKKILGPKNFIGRLGGDNFIIYVKNDQLEAILKTLTAVIVDVNFEGTMMPFTINSRAGIYCPKQGDNHGTVMFNTSVAMGVAKEGFQGDFVWFKPEMTERLMTEKRIVSDFEKAILEDEFIVNYQPKYNLRTKSLCGAEALVCWKRGDRLLPPDEFIPILEKYHRVNELDFYVLRCVCKDINSWRMQGIKPVRISVNFSRRNLADPNFAKKILSIINFSEVPNEFLEIEITETYATDDDADENGFIQEIRKAGIKLALDDFGVGYSTLSVIPKLDFDIIKLDKCFIQSLDSKRQCGFLSNLIHMLTALDYEVVCEGIETEEQYSFLEVVGCTVGQGYYFSRNISREEFEKLL